MNAVQEALFDILESEADYKYYLWIAEESKWAEEPAFLICSGAFAKWGKRSHTVYFGNGLADWTFKTEKETKDKVFSAISKAKTKFEKVKQVNHKGKVKILSIPIFCEKSS